MTKGTIIRRVIRGKERFYHQWREDGKTKSRYLKPDEIIPLRAELEKSAAPAPRVAAAPDAICTPFLTGRLLDELCASVQRLKPRRLVGETIAALEAPAPAVILSVGAPRSGKTTALYQALAALPRERRAEAAYLSAPASCPVPRLLSDLATLRDRGVRLFFLDGLERVPDCVALLPALADTLGAVGCRFVCAGDIRAALDGLALGNGQAVVIAADDISFVDFQILTGSDSLDAYLDSRGLAREIAAEAHLLDHLGAVARRNAAQKLRRERAERMLADVILEEMKRRRTSTTTTVFRLELPHGGMDLVVADSAELTCELYEVRYAAERDDRQLHRLLNSHNLDQIEHRYGMITTREVFYLGRNAWHPAGIFYRNAEKFLTGC